MMKRIAARRSWAILLITLVFSCTKTEDPPRKIGKPIPPPASPTKTLKQLLDSLPNITLYKTALSASGLQHTIDSLRGTNTMAPFTLFIPTDAAFNAAGYTAGAINAAGPAFLDTLVRYLAISGNFSSPSIDLQRGGLNVYPLMYKDPALTRSQVPGVFTPYNSYYYTLNVAYSGNALLLNGRQVSAAAVPIQATDGTIMLTDSLTTKPFYETWQVLGMDTSYQFYVAALKISDSIYTNKGIISDRFSDQSFNDTLGMVLNQGQLVAGYNPFAIVFAPDNNAFRKAGFNSISDISNYISNSALAAAPPFTYMMTNMDSILVNHRMFCNLDFVGVGRSYIYTGDILANPGISVIDLRANTGGVITPDVSTIIFQTSGNQISIHRKDAPNGRAANFSSPVNITTLNGVIHRVDNLMLPTP